MSELRDAAKLAARQQRALETLNDVVEQSRAVLLGIREEIDTWTGGRQDFGSAFRGRILNELAPLGGSWGAEVFTPEEDR